MLQKHKTKDALIIFSKEQISTILEEHQKQFQTDKKQSLLDLSQINLSDYLPPNIHLINNDSHSLEDIKKAFQIPETLLYQNIDFSGSKMWHFMSHGKYDDILFNEINGKECDFMNSSFNQCSFINAYLSHSFFNHSNIEHCYFIGSDLYYARLYETHINKTDFSFSNLMNANLANSSFHEVNFNGAQMAGIEKYLFSTEYKELLYANFQNCSFKNSIISLSVQIFISAVQNRLLEKLSNDNPDYTIDWLETIISMYQSVISYYSYVEDVSVLEYRKQEYTHIYQILNDNDLSNLTERDQQLLCAIENAKTLFIEYNSKFDPTKTEIGRYWYYNFIRVLSFIDFVIDGTECFDEHKQPIADFLCDSHKKYFDKPQLSNLLGRLYLRANLPKKTKQ